MTLVYILIGFIGLAGAAIAKDDFANVKAPNFRKASGPVNQRLLNQTPLNPCYRILLWGPPLGPFFCPTKSNLPNPNFSEPARTKN